jgi:5'-3' exonuclease
MFQPGKPNPPFLQQLATLPPRSADLLPSSLRPLLRPDSPFADLYPTTWKVDCSGRGPEFPPTTPHCLPTPSSCGLKIFLYG